MLCSNFIQKLWFFDCPNGISCGLALKIYKNVCFEINVSVDRSKIALAVRTAELFRRNLKLSEKYGTLVMGNGD